MKHIVIVGSGAAALAARASIIPRANMAQVSLITTDSHGPYSKVALVKYVSGQIKREQVFLPVKWSPGERLMMGTTVSSIDRQAKSVTLSGSTGEQSVHYDVLILALGARHEARLGKPFWTLADADAIKEQISAGKDVKIIGAGFVGLHLALALASVGVNVSLIESESQVLPGRVPPKVSRLMQVGLNDRGIAVTLGNRYAPSDEGISGLVIDCTGVAPEIELARASGLRTCTSGILTDQSQRTSDPNIYACGDCARVSHSHGPKRSAGLWHSAAAQGRVAGLHCMGIDAVLEPCTGWNTFSVPLPGGHELTAVSLGDMQSEDATVVECGDPEAGNYHYLSLKGDRVVGYCAVGDIRGAGALVHLQMQRSLEARASEVSHVFPSPVRALLSSIPLSAAPRSAVVKVRW